MKGKRLSTLALFALVVGLVSCYHPYGYRFYPGAPHFSPTNPANIELMRRDPKREHIRLGEVWIKPDRGMSRVYVEGLLREQAAAMGADAIVIVVDRYFREAIAYNYWGGAAVYYERQIVGVAIRFRR